MYSVYHYFFLQFFSTERIRALNSSCICFNSNPFFSNLSNCILSFYANLFLLIYILPCHSILISSLLPSNLSYSILFSSESYFFIFFQALYAGYGTYLTDRNISYIFTAVHNSTREFSMYVHCTVFESYYKIIKKIEF